MTVLPRLHDLRWLWAKVRRRFEHARHERRVRDVHATKPPTARDAGAPSLPWADDATPPGDASALAELRQALAADRERGEAVLRHQVVVLNPEPWSIDITPPVDALDLAAAGEIDAGARASYRRIDWHRDFRSGHRWDPGALYLDVRVAPVAGADIKTPRELSRFQHVAPLVALPGDRGAREFLLQVLDWIDANPVGRGVNWACTMDVALRAVGWIWGLRLFEPQLAGRYPRALARIAASLEAHAAHIEDNLEYYEECTGNHYLANVAGLVHIGAAFPGFADADRWLLFGAQELVSEMAREVHADGGAHEASTHYHRLVAEMFLSSAIVIERLPPSRRARLARVDVRAHRVRPRLRPPGRSGLNLAASGPLLPRTFHEGLTRMAEFTAALVKPNGLVPQIGDNDSARAQVLLSSAIEVRDHRHLLAVAGEFLGRADLASAGAVSALEGRVLAGGVRVAGPAAKLDDPSSPRLLAESGIATLRRGPAWLAFTCGTNGQGGRGGHGHNDKNSFELNVGGLDFIVDGGCPFYSSSPQTRNEFRATAAHNTISVDGREQDVWEAGIPGLFRLPERSKPRLSIEQGILVGRHSGFGAIHERRVTLEESRLILEDRLAVPETRRIHFNLDPQVHVESLEVEADRLHCELVHARGTRLRMSITGVDSAATRCGTFGTGFGCRVANIAIDARLTSARCRTEISWEHE